MLLAKKPYTTAPITSNRSVTTATFQATRRQRACENMLGRFERVSNTADRFDQRLRIPLIDFVAKVVHVDIDDVTERVEVIAPHVIEDLGAREHMTRVPHQVLE